MKSKFKVVLFSVCAMLAFSAGIAATVATAIEPPVAELGAQVGAEVNADGKTYYNFKRGYAEYNGSTAVSIVAGFRKTATGAEEIDASAMTDELAVTSDASIRTIAGEKWTPALEAQVKASFINRYEALAEEGFVCGLACSDIDTWDNVILKQDYRYGSSTANTGVALDKKRNNCYLVYNFAKSETYLVKDDFVNVYEENHRALGAPLGDVGEYYFAGSAHDQFAPEKGRSYRAQLFEKGIILENAGNVEAHVAALQLTAGSDSVILHPVIDDQDILSLVTEKVGNVIVKTMKFVGDLDGEWHPLKEIDWTVQTDKDDNTTSYRMYANYRGGAVIVEYAPDYTAKSIMRYAARNFSATENQDGSVSYDLHPVAVEAVSEYEYLFEGYDANEPEKAVEAGVLEYVRAYDRYAGIKDDKELKALLLKTFRDAYVQAFDEGIVLGYRASAVKKWDHIVLDFKFGDSTAGFDPTGSGKRERMTSLVLNPVDGKAYAVAGGVWQIYKTDEGVGRRALGYPMTNVMYDKKIGDETFDAIQLFQYGYAYLNSESNEYFTQLGYGFDAETGEFTVQPAPAVSEKYGVELKSVTKGGSIFVNYQKGAVKCVLNRKGTRFQYEYYPGRNFDLSKDQNDYTAALLPIESLLKITDITSKGAMPTITVDGVKRPADFETEIRPKIFAKYQQLLESGYFPGFVEGTFDGSWNSIYAQQFIVGDSIGNPFGSSRPGVTALVYDPTAKQVNYLRNSFIEEWQENLNYETFLCPTSDEFNLTDAKYAAYGDYYFQLYSGNGIGVRKGNNAFLTLDYATPQEYLDALPKMNMPSHGSSAGNGFIGSKQK